jgi:hypothetical protein
MAFLRTLNAMQFPYHSGIQKSGPPAGKKRLWMERPPEDAESALKAPSEDGGLGSTVAVNLQSALHVPRRHALGCWSTDICLPQAPATRRVQLRATSSQRTDTVNGREERRMPA